jgi:hypothetical protein
MIQKTSVRILPIIDSLLLIDFYLLPLGKLSQILLLIITLPTLLTTPSEDLLLVSLPFLLQKKSYATD